MKIIGFWTDINSGTISITKESIDHLLADINDFLGTPSRKPPLSRWQHLLGYLNWVLNVFPWGRPALTALYDKTRGKHIGNAGVAINRDVIESLSWFSRVLPQAIGVSFTDSGCWSESEADMVFWTDASLSGISFVFAGNGYTYTIQENKTGIALDIFFLELIGILSALYYASKLPNPPKRLLIHSNSLNSVEVFNSLHSTQLLHTAVLLAVAQIIIQTEIDLRVVHIAGKDNIRADLLSRRLLKEFLRLFPAYRVHNFEPPRSLLSARWQNCF